MTARPRLSIIAPTYREARNVPILFERLKALPDSMDWELIIVDDNSPDGTADVAIALAAEDRRIRCIRRVGRFGLAGAVIEGMLSSSADYVAAIDSDLQHDETKLAPMYEALRDGADLAIGTRVADPGAERGLSTRRQQLSDLGAALFRRISGIAVTDPMSGFFMIRRGIVERAAGALSADGFKILADLLMSAPRGLRIAEIPYVFRKRQIGESKLSLPVALDFLGLVAHHVSFGLLPIRFLLFATIGGFGLVVHFATLFALVDAGWPTRFELTQLIATIVAMTSNFTLNNEFTYRDNRFRGWRKILGLLQFYVVCSIGVGANIGVASWLYSYNHMWTLAGFAGAMAGVVWNYALSASFIWRRRNS
jgi:dolichol-phosphate mannosyltransferase